MKRETKNYLWILVASCLVVAMGIGTYHFGRVQKAEIVPVLRGDFANQMERTIPPAPLPEADFLRDLSTAQRIKDIAPGDWVILNLWASWCPPCLVELPSLQKLSDMYAGKGVTVIGVSIDMVDDLDVFQSDILKRHTIPPIARHWDQMGLVYRAFNPQIMPTTIIIDPLGNHWGSFVGETDWASPDAQAFVNSLIGVQSLDVNSGTNVNKSPTTP